MIWAPDKYRLYIKKNTGADMILWDGSCIVHEEFKAKGILDLKKFIQMLRYLSIQSPDSVVELAVLLDPLHK